MNEILRRKLKPPGPVQAQNDPCDQAWQLALIRAFREGAGLACEPVALGHSRRDLAELPEILPERGLIALLDGPGEALAMLALSFDLMAALIEMQTTRRIGAQPARPRRPTQTDAAMVAGLLDQALAGFDQLLREREGRAAPGFRYASGLEDSRALGLLLEDQPWWFCQVGLSTAEGARHGQVMLALPADLPGLQPAVADPVTAPGEAAQMAAALAGAECRMQAVLTRIRLPLSQGMALRPGQLLELPEGSLARIRLESPDGRLLARAKLGQSRGARALRLTSLTGEEETAEAEPWPAGETGRAWPAAAGLAEGPAVLPAAGPVAAFELQGDDPGPAPFMSSAATGFAPGAEPPGAEGWPGNSSWPSEDQTGTR